MMKKRSIALLLALTLVLGATAGGTLAWLLDKTDPVVNTFTDSDIGVTLAETTGNSYKIIPGHTVAKDPKVTLDAGSEAAYVFVEVIEAHNDTVTGTTEKILQYSVDNTVWTLVPNESNVYYHIVNAEDAAAGWSDYVLTGSTAYPNGYVKFSDYLTKEQMADLADNPTITITAYACQYFQTNGTPFTPAEAWALANPTNP